ncbi:S-layer protein [Levilactobacillus brevis]|uniref:S-layer protein n=1 Tax=Levilactobacillus brevis TaxID=1580 RepID=UPI0035147422
MQSSLKKSLYLGLAALSFAGVAAVSTTASAKSYATAGAYKTLTTDATKRNVEATGSNALYSKPGTVKGAKRVASKTTMKKLANSKKSADYFRAYRVAKTNRGTVYYKVVSMDGKYRGYIYGGKDIKAFAGGIKFADTTTTASMPAKTTGYHLANANKNGLWTAPKNTQYKAKSISLYSANKTDTFTVSKAETKTREGSLYYYVTDDQNSSIAGWIYAGKGYDANATTQSLGGLSLTAEDAVATEDNSVTVNYIGTNGNTVGSKTFVTAVKNTKKDAKVNSDKNINNQTLADFINDATNTPAGYKVSSTNVDTIAGAAVYGGTVLVNVYKAATSTIAFYLPSANGVDAGAQLNAADFAKGKPSITSEQAKALTGDVNNNVVTGGKTVTDGFFTTLYSKLLTASSDTTVNGTPVTKGKTYYVTYTYSDSKTATANANVKFGSTIKAVFDAQTTVADKLPGDDGANNGSTTNY